MGWENDYSGDEPISYNEVEKQINDEILPKLSRILWNNIQFDFEILTYMVK